MDLETKLQRAKTWLLITTPCEASILQGMPMVINSKITQTMAINATHIFYNEDWVKTLNELQIRGLLLHEAQHILRLHNLRMGDRQPSKWNIACDKPINENINNRKSHKYELDLPPNGHLPRYGEDDWSAEKHYALDDTEDGDGDGDGWGEVLFGQGEENKPMDASEQSIQEAKQVQRVIRAYDEAKSRGQDPSFMKGIINEIKRSMVDWTDVLRRFVGGDELDNYSYRRPNKRMYAETEVFMPSIERVGGGDIVVAVDTSGSVDDDELSYFLGELNAVSQDTSPNSITVIPFSTSVGTVKRYEMGEIVEDIKYDDRGGTNVEPVFKYIKEENLNVDNFICLTDLGIYDYPDSHPDYPCLWVSTCEGTKPPFGEVTIIKNWS